MEKKAKKTQWNPKALWDQTKKTLKPVAVKFGNMSFWGVALICLLLRILMVRPMGALAALAVGCVWAYWNISVMKRFLTKLLDGLSRLVGGYEKSSLWFGHGGRDTIEALIALLTVQGVNYCNLVEQIEGFPDESHWYAISNGLRDMGILTQLSHNAFYITWHIPQPDISVFDAV